MVDTEESGPTYSIGNDSTDSVDGEQKIAVHNSCVCHGATGKILPQKNKFRAVFMRLDLSNLLPISESKHVGAMHVQLFDMLQL